MGVINPTFGKLRSQDSGVDALLTTWALLTNTGPDSGKPLQRPAMGDKSVQVTGTFGSGGTVVLEGSNEASPANWFTLTDPAGNAISFTSAGGKQLTEVTAWIRPRVTGGDGTTSLTVQLISRRTLR